MGLWAHRHVNGPLAASSGGCLWCSLCLLFNYLSHDCLGYSMVVTLRAIPLCYSRACASLFTAAGLFFSTSSCGTGTVRFLPCVIRKKVMRSHPTHLPHHRTLAAPHRLDLLCLHVHRGPEDVATTATGASSHLLANAASGNSHSPVPGSGSATRARHRRSSSDSSAPVVCVCVCACVCAVRASRYTALQLCIMSHSHAVLHLRRCACVYA